MIYWVPFEARHFGQMTVQAAQSWMSRNMKAEDLLPLEGPFAVTLMDDGQPIACCGALVYWEGRAFMWSFMSDRVTKRNFLSVYREAVEFLDMLPFRRLEASVDVGFAAGHRWAKLLGFEVETPLQRGFQIDGSDSVGYVRMKVT